MHTEYLNCTAREFFARVQGKGVVRVKDTEDRYRKVVEYYRDGRMIAFETIIVMQDINIHRLRSIVKGETNETDRESKKGSEG